MRVSEGKTTKKNGTYKIEALTWRRGMGLMEPEEVGGVGLTWHMHQKKVDLLGPCLNSLSA